MKVEDGRISAWELLIDREAVGMRNVGVNGRDINDGKQGVGKEGNGEGTKDCEEMVGVFDV